MKQAGAMQDDMDKKTLYIHKVNNKVWPYLKFLVPPDIDNVSDGSVCHLLANEFKIPSESRAVWWHGLKNKNTLCVKEIVAHKLSDKRNGASQVMKAKFIGKLACHVFFYWDIDLHKSFFASLFEAAMAINCAPKLDNVLKLRADKSGEFEYFVTYLVPSVTNHRWSKKHNVMARSPFCDATSTTDEGFALLLFENNYDTWIYEYHQKVQSGKAIPVVPDPVLPSTSVVYCGSPLVREQAKLLGAPAEKAQQDLDKPKPKYTRVDNCEGKRYQGWSEKGLARFNQLVKMVKDDREKNNEWDQKFLEYHQMTVGKNAGGQQPKDVLKDPKDFTRPMMNLEEAFAQQGQYTKKRKLPTLEDGSESRSDSD